MPESKNLYQVSAEWRRAILEDLKRGEAPSLGSFEPAVLEEAQKLGVVPQMGNLRYQPTSVVAEFIFAVPGGAAILLPVTIPAPERIVYMPVPSWVVQNVWQGEVLGAFHFESTAKALLGAYEGLLLGPENEALFETSTDFVRR